MGKGYLMLVIFGFLFILFGVSVRKNWWGLGDIYSGGHAAGYSLRHRKSWRWKGVRAFGVAFILMGSGMLISFLWGTVIGEG